jgi:hypothetical protein
LFPHFNASFDAGTNELILKQYYHIGVAVDTESGLVVPVVRDCDQKSILEIADELSGGACRRQTARLLRTENPNLPYPCESPKCFIVPTNRAGSVLLQIDCQRPGCSYRIAVYETNGNGVFYDDCSLDCDADALNVHVRGVGGRSNKNGGIRGVREAAVIYSIRNWF